MVQNLESDRDRDLAQDMELSELDYLKKMNEEISKDSKKFSGEMMEPVDVEKPVEPVPEGTYCMQSSLYYALRTLGEDVTVEQCIKVLGTHEGKIDLVEISNDTMYLFEFERGTPVSVYVKYNRTYAGKEFNREELGVDTDKDIIEPMMRSIRDKNVLILNLKTPNKFKRGGDRVVEETEEHAVTVVGFDYNENKAPLFKIYDNRISIPIWVPARRLAEQSYMSHLELQKIPLQAADA